MNVTPRFSFNYNGKPFDLPGVKVLKEAFGYSYCTEDGLVVELHIEEYPEYGAAGWTLWFENKGVSDMKTASPGGKPLFIPFFPLSQIRRLFL